MMNHIHSKYILRKKKSLQEQKYEREGRINLLTIPIQIISFIKHLEFLGKQI